MNGDPGSSAMGGIDGTAGLEYESISATYDVPDNSDLRVFSTLSSEVSLREVESSSLVCSVNGLSSSYPGGLSYLFS